MKTTIKIAAALAAFCYPGHTACSQVPTISIYYGSDSLMFNYQSDNIYDLFTAIHKLPPADSLRFNTTTLLTFKPIKDELYYFQAREISTSSNAIHKDQYYTIVQEEIIKTLIRQTQSNPKIKQYDKQNQRLFKFIESTGSACLIR